MTILCVISLVRKNRNNREEKPSHITALLVIKIDGFRVEPLYLLFTGLDADSTLIGSKKIFSWKLSETDEP